MERKPQQQTLSIRISEGLREFLERSKHIISTRRGESVSTSDVAKILLESARDDRLDYRLEVAELQQHATASLCALREKSQAGQAFSRAEWIFLAQYIQVACEARSATSALPCPASMVVLLECFLAVRSLRVERGASLDRYYLGNLGGADDAGLNERQIDPDTVPAVVNRLIAELRASGDTRKAAFAGRNFYVAVRDEVFSDMAALNRVLEPGLGTLFRLAARGHWFEKRIPLRVRPGGPIYTSPLPTIEKGNFRITFSRGPDGEISLALNLLSRDLIYPVAPYPQIREFAALVATLAAGDMRSGDHFHASAEPSSSEGGGRFHFQRHTDGVLLSFNEADWATLREAIAAALADERIKTILSELSLVYGEL